MNTVKTLNLFKFRNFVGYSTVKLDRKEGNKKREHSTRNPMYSLGYGLKDYLFNNVRSR